LKEACRWPDDLVTKQLGFLFAAPFPLLERTRGFRISDIEYGSAVT
jgi:hypothetical protein